MKLSDCISSSTFGGGEIFATVEMGACRTSWMVALFCSGVVCFELWQFSGCCMFWGGMIHEY